MKNCCAGHEPVDFSSARCPVCENIERLDKQLLRADIQIVRMQDRIVELERQNNKLTNAQVSNLKENYNGGPC